MMKRLLLLLGLMSVCAIMGIGCGGSNGTRDRADAVNSTCMANTIGPEELDRCQVVTEPYVRYDDPDAVAFNDLPIALYFFPQTPPAQTEILSPIQSKAVVSAKEGTCRDAGLDGLVRLQRLARRHGANAVVNIRSTWNNEQLGDEIYFGCKVTRGRYALIWEGALARTPGPETDGAQDAPAGGLENGGADGGQDDAHVKARLRKLEELYYQGLISRKEYLERRKGILDAL